MELVRNEEKRAEYTKRAKELVSKMTLEEKVQQTLYQAPAIERLGIKAYNWWNEALHGVARAGAATVFPQAIGLAATFDEDLAEEVAEAVSTEGRAKFNMQQEYDDTDIYKGLTFWSPNVNIFRDPRWGRGHETFGEDPYLTSRMGVRYVEGLQGHVSDDDDGAQGDRGQLGEDDRLVELPLAGAVDPGGLTQVVGNAAEAGQEQRHDVSGQLPHGRQRDGQDPPGGVLGP